MAVGDRRRKRKEERHQFGRGGVALRYQMRQKILSIGDDYWVEDDQGDRVYKIDGKALRLRQTMDLEDANGTKLCRIQTRMLHLRDTMAVETPDGDRLALVHKALITPLRERWKVDVENGPDLSVHGNIVDHEYEIERDGDTVASVSKKWFRVRDTYGVQLGEDQDVALILAITVCVDAMARG